MSMTHPDQPTSPEGTAFPSSIDGPEGSLEVAVKLPSTREFETGVAVLAHPHPLYGGNMDNAVVRRTAQRLRERGHPTVRFNFRGVGGSDGVHHGGDGEVADLSAVVDWCQARFDQTPILLVGYSFGAATILRAAPRADILGILLIAPPLSFHDVSQAPMTAAFRSNSGAAAVPVALLYGAEDELTAPPHRGQTARWAVQLEEELPGVAHDLGAAGGADERARFDAAVDRCLAVVAPPQA